MECPKCGHEHESECDCGCAKMACGSCSHYHADKEVCDECGCG